MTASFLLLITYFFLGFVQGITEPLPISSSGHLVILRDLFHVQTPGLTFEIIVHFASLIAVILVYRKDIATLCKESILFMLQRNKKYKSSFIFSCYLGFATIITGSLGLFLEQFISDTLTKPIYVGVAFLVTAFFIWLIRHLEGSKADQDITLMDAFLIGLAQTFALIPGISRSGATLVTGMLLGLKRTTALRFSFLLFIPIGLGVNLLSLPEMKGIIQEQQLLIPYVIAFITALLATYYALKLFIRVMLKGKLILFSIYCFFLGMIVVLTNLF